MEWRLRLCQDHVPRMLLLHSIDCPECCSLDRVERGAWRPSASAVHVGGPLQAGSVWSAFYRHCVGCQRSIQSRTWLVVAPTTEGHRSRAASLTVGRLKLRTASRAVNTAARSGRAHSFSSTRALATVSMPPRRYAMRSCRSPASSTTCRSNRSHSSGDSRSTWHCTSSNSTSDQKSSEARATRSKSITPSPGNFSAECQGRFTVGAGLP